MSIFATSSDPLESAVVLCDQRLRSQMGYTASVLSSVLHKHDLASGPLIGPPAEVSARFVEWAAASWDNFMWLAFYGLALCEEHAHRFGVLPPTTAQIVACANVGYLVSDKDSFSPVSWERCEEAPTHSELSVFEANQKFLSHEWRCEDSPPRWTSANPPQWVWVSPR